MVYGTYNYSIYGVYKPSNITRGPHLVVYLSYLSGWIWEFPQYESNLDGHII